MYALALAGTDSTLEIFTKAGGITVNYIAKWDGAAWSALGTGAANPLTTPTVNALAVSGSNLYAGGFFATLDGVTVNGIAKWDGTSWSALGSGIGGVVGFCCNDHVSALATTGNDLYAGGQFSKIGDVSANGIAKWDGTNWSALGPGFDYVYALGLSGTNLYAGGEGYVVKWNGASWTMIGPRIAYTYLNGPCWHSQ